MAVGALATKAIPYLGKHFWKWIIPALIAGQTGVSEYGKAGERKLTKKQLELQNLLQQASAEASKRGVLESRKSTKEYTQTLLKARREEQQMAKEQQMMESFTASQDRQMALVLQAVQAMSQSASPAKSGSGMLGLMRSNL